MFNASFPRPEPVWLAGDFFGEPQVLEGIVLYSFEERRVTRFCIEPYGRIPGHTLKCEQEFTVIAGSGTLYTSEPRDPEPMYHGGDWRRRISRLTLDDISSELVATGDHRTIRSGFYRSIHAEESGLVIEIPWRGE